MAIYKPTRNPAKIWENLGTFWGQFPDKELITKLWESYLDVSDILYRSQVKVHLSKYLEYLSPVLSDTAETYETIFTGDDKNILTISGLSSYKIDNYIFNIPTLSGIETGQVLEENTDYKILNNKYIQFLTQPEYDSANSAISDQVTLYADSLYRHNPVLWDVHASGIGLPVSSLDNEDYLPYNIIAESGIDRVIDIAEHYKYLIWALEDIKSRQPTINNLKNGFGISRGLPFSYHAGQVNSIENNTITVLVSGLTDTYDTYVLPSGVVPTVSGEENIPRFYMLASGIEFYDHINAYDHIISLAGTNEINYTSYIDFGYDSSISNLPHNSAFHIEYVSSLIPAGLQYYGLLGEILTELEDQGDTIDEISESQVSILGSDAMKSTSLAPEFLTISATDASSSSANFSSYTADTIQEVVIQNLDDANDVYVSFSSTEAPEATTDSLCIPAGSELSFINTDYVYFAAITESGAALVRITGLGY